ncbi:hotdog domain-containing protein [Nocardioides sp. CER19]|uniref:acyl-CoA thioesterase n=1 Tax=Nocardioides sp. CER19 TaxID=3038538 RepID=UPI002448B43A|nr:hotdog domain-containing protein [Nocardioides sp. CER19]MDH2414351.1 hotdog domain-containing protein [Nocardioides sp. CER19]
MSEGQPTGVFHTRVEWIDTDASGIYHNSTVTRFVEAAEATLFRSRGIEGYFPSAPRVRYEADFLAPLVFGQDVTAIVWLARLGTSSMTWEFEVWGEAFEGRARVLAARGSYVTVHLGSGPAAFGEARSSRPWPAEWVASLAAGCGS